MAKTFKLRILTMDKIVYDGEATKLLTTAENGNIEFLANCAPCIASLVPCITTIVNEKEEKLNPLETDADVILGGFSYDTQDLSKKLLSRIEGFSPLICREIEHRSVRFGLKEAYLSVLKDLNQNKPVLVSRPDGTPFEYSFTDISPF